MAVGTDGAPRSDRANDPANEAQGRRPPQTHGETPQTHGEPSVILGRYRLQRRLGAGGFGTVWQAHDERLDREVAVKIVVRERVNTGRFEREAKAAARLQHPNIVTLYEAGADDDGAYLVSELVRGATLDELVSQGRLSDRDIVEVGIALCDALEHAHGQDVIHRDVKPSNVLIPKNSRGPRQAHRLRCRSSTRRRHAHPDRRRGRNDGVHGARAGARSRGRRSRRPVRTRARPLRSANRHQPNRDRDRGPARTPPRSPPAPAAAPATRAPARARPRARLALRPEPRERGTIGSSTRR